MSWKSLVAAVLLGLIVIQDAPANAGPDGITIGVLNDQSGPYADITGKGSVVAAQMAVEDFGGSVLGKPVKLISADHQQKVDIATSIARKWLDLEKVDLIVDVPNSGILLAIQDIVRSKSGILIAAGGGTSKFTGEACSPYGFMWVYDSYALANTMGRAVTERGGKSWFFLPVDYAWGEALSADLSAAIKASGGKIVGSVKTPLNTPDYSSFLLQAQASKADVVALLNAGADTINSVKQAHEFGITQGQRLATGLFYLNDAYAVGLRTAQGLIVADGYYWDRTPETRAWAERFQKRHQGRMPSSIQMGVYSAVLHYLKSAAAAATDDRDAIAKKMRELPVRDAMVPDGRVREDGIMLHDILLLQVKTPAESKSEWDLFKILSATPGEKAYRPLGQGNCPLVAQR
ncbi:ABC transporter substrate-binding protein [Bradyrhizobium cenepequi]|uniref:ABC transporter substrate-binding protein n=1 Tax=Bradyrhizobium cenepequi TaxID=2821403 RepID=UPI001CE31BAF|nr:ABC transporter substrate-binding protein [Bradyrhizobium cenepequi]MCA6113126.1 ABC transporter substrate-binding protein [Bradyrhizobium cenepequi]